MSRYHLAGAWRTLCGLRREYRHNVWKAKRDADFDRATAHRRRLADARRTVALESDPVIASIVASQNTVIRGLRAGE